MEPEFKEIRLILNIDSYRFHMTILVIFQRGFIVKNYKRAVSFGLSLAIILLSVCFIKPQMSYAIDGIERIEGEDRYDTALKISMKGWSSADNVVLTTGEDFPDALCAVPLAKKLNAPILLTKSADISDRVLNRIRQLNARNVYIAGGSSVVSDKIYEKLIGIGLNVKRIAGSDRYGTSIEIAKFLTKQFGTSGSIAVVTGNNYPDALSIAPAAAVMGMPILLADRNSVSSALASYIKESNVTKTYLIGGSGIIGNNVEKSLPNAERIWGGNRYETNARILMRFKKQLNFSTTYIATGEDFPDALSGAALAPATSSPVVLTDRTPGQFTTDLINIYYPEIKKTYILGGDMAVSNAAWQILASSNVNGSGNTLSNINNFGIAAVQEGWIYYSNYSDSQRLYKMKVDGSENMLFVKNSINVSHINVVGGWIYYSGDNGSVYKVRTDGTGQSVVIDEEVSFLYVSGGYIYFYSSGSLNRMELSTKVVKTLITTDDRWHYSIGTQGIYFTDGGKLYKTNLNGEGKTLVINESIVDFNVNEKYIFYLTPDQKIYRAGIDGKGSTLLAEDRAENMNISGNFIYYINAMDRGLYSISIDGTGRRRLGDNKLSGVLNTAADMVLCANFNVSTPLYSMKADGSSSVKIADYTVSSLRQENGRMYYVNIQDEAKIYSMNNDGSNVKSLGVSSAGDIEVYGGWIYYSSSKDGNTLHKVRTDGTGDIRIDGISSIDFKVSDGFIYYSSLTEDNRLYSARTDGSEKNMLSQIQARNIAVSNGRIYYIYDGSEASNDYGIYSVNTDGTGSRLIENVHADSMAFSGGYMIYKQIDGNKIVRENPDGSNKLILSGGNVEYAADGRYMYAIDMGNTDDIIRYDLDSGSTRTYSANGYVFDIYALSGTVYYQVNDSTQELYKIPVW